MSKNADIKLGYACNDHCIHCVVEKLRDIANKNKETISTDEYKNEILKNKQLGIKRITITGGEPTIRKDFLEIIKFTKKNDLNIHLQSNGRKFSDIKFTIESVTYIDIFEIALHGNQKIHELVTQTQNSYEETITGIKNILKLGGKIYGKIVLSKINYKYILETLKIYENLGVKIVSISFPHSSGEKNYLKNVAPYYLEIKSYIQEALDYYEDKLFHIELEDIHPCALDKEYPIRHFQEFYQKTKKTNLKLISQKTQKWEYLRGAIKLKFPKCQDCIYNLYCDGYWKEYIEERGSDEFNPIKNINKKNLFDKNDLKIISLIKSFQN